MFLIAGLGNPERKYDKTKHNAGFDAVDVLSRRHNISVQSLSMKGLYGKGVIEGEKAMLLKPLTYMNLSGEAIRAYTDYYKIDPETQLIVIYDDVDIPTGQLRVRKSGSAGSHNGMRSIVSTLGTQKFIRVRVGTGPCPERWDMVDYVLAPFSKEDRKLVDEALEEAADAVELIVSGGIDRAMEKYNKKVKLPKEEIIKPEVK